MHDTIDSQGSPRGIRALCVGLDADAVAEPIQREHSRISTVTEPTLADALSRLEVAEHVDCIVSSDQLPVQDGITLLHRVRDEFGDLPFVFVVRNGSEERAMESINADADGYFRREDGDAELYRRVGERITAVVEEHQTRRTQAETRQRLLRLAESSDSAVWMFTGDWSELVYVNDTYEDLWGRSAAALEEDPTDFMAGIHPDYREEVRDAMGALSEGEPVELEYRVNPTEEYRRWVTVQGEPVFDDTGDIEYVAGYARDITERKRRAEQLERQTEEMEVFNSLLQHDVLNGTTIIQARAEMLADEVGGKQRQDVETIRKWAENISGLVQRIREVLETLTGEQPDLERVNLSERLREQIEIVSESYPQVPFDADVPDDVVVPANELLTDVFKNLLTNAVEHNETEGLRIETTVTVGAETVTVRIADNGEGVPDELKEAIFHRGRSESGDAGDSGFGLFFVDAMVTAYGGDVSVEDNEMGGATFVVELPTEQV